MATATAAKTPHVAPHKRGTTAGRHIEQHSPLPKGRACAMCKARKVRCDAGIPACSACKRTARFEGRDPELVCCVYSWKNSEQAPKPKPASLPPPAPSQRKDSSDVPVVSKPSLPTSRPSIPLSVPITSNKLPLILPASNTPTDESAIKLPYKPLTVVTDIKPKRPTPQHVCRKLAPATTSPQLSSSVSTLPASVSLFQPSPASPTQVSTTSISLPANNGFANYFTSNEFLTPNQPPLLVDDDVAATCSCFLNDCDFDYYEKPTVDTASVVPAVTVEPTVNVVRDTTPKRRANSFDSVESFDTMTTATTISTHSLESLPEKDELLKVDTASITGSSFTHSPMSIDFDFDFSGLMDLELDLPPLLSAKVEDEDDISFC